MMQDRVLHSKKIDWKQIQTLQPDNFKLPEQQEVLKKSLLANGFVSPFCVWQDTEGVIWSIDGVHRIKALTELQEQGQDIPELLTANFIEAKDRKEAGIILLEVFNTKQNKATEQGVELLKIDLNISNDDLHVDFEDLNINININDAQLNEDEAQDLFTVDEPEESEGVELDNPTKTTEGYVEFSIVLSQENKNSITNRINSIRRNYPELIQEEIFMSLIK